MTGRSVAAALCAAVALTTAGPQAQPAPLTPAGTIPGPAELVRAAGGYAYVAAGKTLTVYDISTPASPRRRGSHDFPDKVWGFRVYGSLLYVANGFNGLQILDVANPDAPAIRGGVKTQGQSKNVAVSGPRAVVANHMTGVDLLDVSDSAAPAYIGSAFLDGYARDAAMTGTIAYAVDNPSGLYVLDVAAVRAKAFDPSHAVQEAHTPQVIELSGAGAASPFAVLAGGEPYDPTRPRPAGVRPRGTLQVWDLANPAAPTLAALYRTPGIPRHVTVQGTLAYVADSEDGVHVVDLARPANPVFVTSFKTPAPARNIAVTGSTVLVVVGGPPATAGQPASAVTLLTHTR